MNKISTKIWVGFISLILIMSVMVGFNFYQLQSLKKEMNTLADNNIPLLVASKNLELAVARQSSAIRGYLATGNRQFIQELENARFFQNQNLRFLEEKEPNQESISAVKKAIEAFTAQPARMISLYETQGRDVALEYMATTEAPISAKTIETTNIYVQYQEKAINDAAEKMLAVEKQIETYSLILLVLGIIVGGVLAYFITAPISKGIKQIVAFVNGVAGGDLTGKLEFESKDDLGQLAKGVKDMREQLREVVKQIIFKSKTVSQSSEQLNVSSKQTASSANDNAVTINQISAIVQQVTSNIQDIWGASKTATAQASEGNQGINRVTEQMQNITQTTQGASQVIDGLSKKSQEINQIVELITSIADQTNLLALNAAIEAARAGEQGRGFAVVAEEVRELAEKSGSAAKEIYTLINAIQAEASKAVDSMVSGVQEVEIGTEIVTEVGENFKEIISAVEDLTEQIQSVASATEEMSAGVQNVAASTEEQKAAMDEVSLFTESLNDLAQELSNAVAKFRIR